MLCVEIVDQDGILPPPPRVILMGGWCEIISLALLVAIVSYMYMCIYGHVIQCIYKFLTAANLLPCRSDYQKISQKLKERKQPPPLPNNLPPGSRPSLVGNQLIPERMRERSETVVGPPPALVAPLDHSYEVSALLQHTCT